MCAMAVNALGLSDQVAAAGRRTLFSDVAPSAWYNGYVNAAYGEGLVNGYGNGTFGPDDPVTYGQVATILLRMLGYTSAEVGSLWPLDYTDFCDELGLSQGLTLSPNGSLTRGRPPSSSTGPCWRTSMGHSSPAMRPSTGCPPPPRPSCWTWTPPTAVGAVCSWPTCPTAAASPTTPRAGSRATPWRGGWAPCSLTGRGRRWASSPTGARPGT